MLRFLGAAQNLRDTRKADKAADLMLRAVLSQEAVQAALPFMKKFPVATLLKHGRIRCDMATSLLRRIAFEQECEVE